ncbi:MAG: class I SAM-dependent methyltransferase [Deltaproteobacteria bacterium]
MSDIYRDGRYAQRNTSYHTEDSAWKARSIARLMAEHGLAPKKIAEIGCGAGQVIAELSRDARWANARFVGYDISPQAIELARRSGGAVEYVCGDLLESAPNDIELLLCIDVFEHVPDYLGFLEKCRGLARHHVFHIPLDLHVSSVLRNSFLGARKSVGHLHYFTAESALATLRDAGFEVVSRRLMNPAADLFWNQPTWRRAVANIPRWAIGRLSEPLAARLLGGYTLLVLARGTP